MIEGIVPCRHRDDGSLLHPHMEENQHPVCIERARMSRKLMVAVMATSIVGLTWMACAPSTPTRTRVDVSALGPQVGEQVPDFSLPDQNGKIWTRQSIMGPNGAMLVFVRSANW